MREALRRWPQLVLEVFVSVRPGKRRAEIEALCRRHRVKLSEVSSSYLSGIAGTGRHNGFGARRKIGEPDRVPGGDPGLQVLVEDIQDPRNLGALMRVCEGVGVSRFLLRDRGSAPFSPAVAKTSAGAIEWLNVERIVNSARTIEQLKAQGYWVYGADTDGELPWEIDLTGKVLLCFGGEAKGLRAQTRKICDRLVGLPMRGHVESLNLATAAAAVLYEAIRQRG